MAELERRGAYMYIYEEIDPFSSNSPCADTPRLPKDNLSPITADSNDDVCLDIEVYNCSVVDRTEKKYKDMHMKSSQSSSKAASKDNPDSSTLISSIKQRLGLVDLLPNDTSLSNASPRAWLGTKVPYRITPDLSSKLQDCIKDAVKIFNESVLYLRWVERVDEPDYVEFIFDANETSSYVGRVGGRQEIKVADWAEYGNVLHEMGHAIGLHHEHSRCDRDRYVVVRQVPDVNWEKQSPRKSTPLSQYDYKSIMHYGGVCKKSKNRYCIFGKVKAQRKHFTELDKKAIKFMYGPLVCTFDSHNKILRSLICFVCHTCWGDRSDFFCCYFCALTHHEGHDFEQYPLKQQKLEYFACACGKNKHELDVCTRHITNSSPVFQPLYHCKCLQVGSDMSKKCCFQCETKCHRTDENHTTRIEKLPSVVGVCQCNFKGNCKIPHPTQTERLY